MNSRNKSVSYISLETGYIFRQTISFTSNEIFYCLGRKYRFEGLKSKYDYHKKAWIITRKKEVVFTILLTAKQYEITERRIAELTVKTLIGKSL